MGQTQTLSLETPWHCKVCLAFCMYFYLPLDYSVLYLAIGCWVSNDNGNFKCAKRN